MLLHRGFGEVLGSLAACGYNAEWDCLPAAAFGAPHRRDRVFIVAYTSGHGREWWQHEQERESRSSHPTDSWSDGEQGTASDTDGRMGWSRQSIDDFASTEGANLWPTEPRICGVSNGVPNRVDRLRCLGNAVVPVIAEYIGRLIMDLDREVSA